MKIKYKNRTPYAVLIPCFVLLLGLNPINAGETQTPEDHGKGVTKIYFIPFAVETFMPVTMNDIEENNSYIIWLTKDHSFTEKLEKELESKAVTKKIDNRGIRLKVAFGKDGNVFYVDREGTVLKNDHKNFQISKKQLEELEREILYFSGIVDMKESKSLGNFIANGLDPS